MNTSVKPCAHCGSDDLGFGWSFQRVDFGEPACYFEISCRCGAVMRIRMRAKESEKESPYPDRKTAFKMAIEAWNRRVGE